MKRTALSRYTRINPVSERRRARSGQAGKLGIVRLTGQDLADLRWQCWVRDAGHCVDCKAWTHYAPRFDGDPQAYDMAHKQSRGAGGSDTLDNVVTKCHRCHMREHNGKRGIQ